jgi:PPOX class probable F420-dependent enzyme
LDDARVARLGLIDDRGRPRVLPVTYALVHGQLVTAVDHKRKQVSPERIARVRWLRAQPAAALTVDHYEENWSRLRWVQAIGAVTICDAASAPDAIAGLMERYEPYRERPPSGPVLALAPERLLWWRS